MVTNEQRARASEGQSYGRQRDSDDTDDTQEYLHLSACVRTLQDAAKLALSGNGKDEPVFRYARAIKAFEITTGRKLKENELKPAFNVWWSLAKARLPKDCDREECLYLFLDGYEKAKTPLGANVIKTAIERAKNTPPPPEAARYENPKLKKLVHFCRELQRIMGDNPFFLGVRDAAKVMGNTSNEIASSLLHGLVRDGILKIIQKGTPGGRRATRFKYSSKVLKT